MERGVNALIRDVEGYLTGGPIAAYRESIFARWTRYLWAGPREKTP